MSSRGILATVGLALAAIGLAGLGATAAFAGTTETGAGAPAGTAPGGAAAAERVLLDRYCVACHNARLQTAGLELDTADVTRVAANPALWEKVVRKLRAGAMPPAPRPRPDEATYGWFIDRLETELDAAAAADPRSGADGGVPPAEPRRIPQRDP